MFEVKKTELFGCYEITGKVVEDERGAFRKIFNSNAFEHFDLSTDFREHYYTVSKKNVLRGLHFQIPPHEHAKLIYVIKGSILDAALDLRKAMPTYGAHITVELSETNAKALYLPSGVAHGFLTLSEEAVVSYSVTSVYSPEHDAGILWSSAGIAWLTSEPILSQRDHEFPPLESFESPF